LRRRQASFVGPYPFLGIAETASGSLRHEWRWDLSFDLSWRLIALVVSLPYDHRRFRANLYVDGLEPEAELGWLGRVIKAGDAELEVTSRCERCKVITMDPDTTETTPEVLRVLVERHDERMGMYCRVVRPGRVAVGDSVG